MNNKNPDNQAFDAASNIAYSEGAVVSKTVVKNASGNISLFAFDKGEGLAEHSTPHEAFVQVLDGTVEITIGGQPHLLSQGQCLLMPANIPHALKAVEKFKMMLVMLKNN